ncbi:MAG TPA: cobalamin-dependent protein [Verrucomicrobiae bacterium]|nr:cobalamin-dependent protein [Verrucomicrobiae bacterium]
MRFLFLHTPKFKNYYRPIGSYSFIVYPPMGILGLADLLRQNHHRARVIHLGVEDLQHHGLNFERILSEEQPAIVGLDLHWHFQSYDVIEVARKIKQIRPEIGIVLGGFTASIFAEEILRDYPFVDFVIRGDGEIPLLQLVEHFESDQCYEQVPNLGFRRESKVVLNPTSYQADSAMLDRLRFTDFRLMKDYRVFIDSFSQCSRRATELSETLQKRMRGAKKWFQVYIGRGCYHNCFFCGGSAGSQMLIGGRRCVALRSPEKVVASIEELASFGFEFVSLPLDSIPPDEADRFYLPIIEQMKRLNITLDLEVERYYLPTPKFIESFRGLAGKGSFITLSPHTHNEELRKKNGLYRYSNQELEDCCDLMEAQGVNFQVCFTCGLPFETREDLEAIASYQSALKKKYKRLSFAHSLIEIEPGSPMSRNPTYYGVTPQRTTFADYYRYHSVPNRNYILEMGYTRAGCPDHEEVSSFFCRHFCDRFHSGWFSPVICSIRSAIWKSGVVQAADRLLIDKT